MVDLVATFMNRGEPRGGTAPGWLKKSKVSDRAWEGARAALPGGKGSPLGTREQRPAARVGRLLQAAARKGRLLPCCRAASGSREAQRASPNASANAPLEQGRMIVSAARLAVRRYSA